MFCSNCGKEIDKTAKFCDNCGKKISRENSKVGAEKKESEIEEVKVKRGEDQPWHSIHNFDEYDENMGFKFKNFRAGENFPESIQVVNKAGTTVHAAGIMALIFSPLIIMFTYEDIYTIIGTILVISILLVIDIYLGAKLRNDRLIDIQKTRKRINFLILYTFFLIFSAGFGGIFVLFSLIDLFKAKKELKRIL